MRLIGTMIALMLFTDTVSAQECTKFRKMTTCTDRFGNTTITTAYRFRNTTTYSDGTTAHRYGNTTVYRNGLTSQTFGKITTFSDGRTCTRFGNTIFCN